MYLKIDLPITFLQYWVPRVRLLFAAENPYRFTRRVVEAHKLRLDSESVIRYVQLSSTQN